MIDRATERFVTMPYRVAERDGDCPHCAVSIERGDGSLVTVSNGHWCRACGTKVAVGDIDEYEGGFTYERYRHSKKVRLLGGYTEAWPDDHTRRDENSIVEGEGIGL